MTFFLKEDIIKTLYFSPTKLSFKESGVRVHLSVLMFEF